MLSKRPTQGLYAITDEQLIAPDALIESVAQAITGGARIIQYRNKHGDAQLRIRQAEALRICCTKLDALLIINDDLELAARVRADGVHIGQSDVGYAEARRVLGAAALIGVTCYNSLPQALAAQQAGADYVAFGRFYPSSSKPMASPATIDVLHQAAQQLSIPIVAIGGITPENGRPLLEAGADYLAVINGLFASSDISAAARRYTALFNDL